MTRMILVLITVITIISCKELNDQYPPQPWDVFFYQNDKVSPRDISAMYYENDHEWWMGARGNESLIHGNGYTIEEAKGDDDLPAMYEVRAIKRDGLNRLWVAWNGGLACFNSGKWKNFEEFHGMDVTSVAVRGLADIWVSVNDKIMGGIASFKNNRWSWIRKDAGSLPSGEITCMQFDESQKMWIGTADTGLIVFDGDTYEIVRVLYNAAHSNHITCLHMLDGNIWAGTADAWLLHIQGDQTEELSTGTNSPITAIESGTDGTLWIATLGNGLITYDGQNWSGYNKTGNRLPSDSIYTLASIGQGRMLAACAGGKIIRFHP